MAETPVPAGPRSCSSKFTGDRWPGTEVSALGVVPALDELEDRLAGSLRVGEAGTVEQLAFQGGEEGLGHGVVVKVPDGTHRGPHPGDPTAVPEREGGVLTPLVGVVDHRLGPPVFERHLQGVQNQRGAQVHRHRPAHHAPAAGVRHHCQMQHPRHRRNKGDVGHPELEAPRNVWNSIATGMKRRSSGRQFSDARGARCRPAGGSPNPDWVALSRVDAGGCACGACATGGGFPTKARVRPGPLHLKPGFSLERDQFSLKLGFGSVK